MKRNRKLSPFRELVRAIESELFNLALEMQNEETKWTNTDFVLGYRCALNVMLERAYAIYYRKLPSTILTCDEAVDDLTGLLERD